MTTILTVDDASDVRAAVGRTLRGAGFTVLEADTGAAGLAVLDGQPVDLILLDVMMPVMDGPTMLRELRGRGDRTPVILVTSESSRELVAGVLQLGLTDYILKPFKPDGLKAKIERALRRPTAIASTLAHGSSAALRLPPRPTFDLLVIDDMDTVHQRLQQALPAHVSIHGAVNAEAALGRCRDQAYRLVLLDLVMPDGDSFQLLRQLQTLQPQAVFLALSLRTAAESRVDLTGAGFADLVHKPFDPDTITRLVERVFDVRELVEIDGERINANGCPPKDDRVEEHHAALRPALKRAIETVADSGRDQVIVDLRRVPMRGERTIRMVMDLRQDADRRGIRLKLVATAEVATLLRRVADTADVELVERADAARPAA